MANRLFKLVFSILFMILIKINNLFLRIIGINTQPFLVVLYYHSVFPEFRNNFDRQMKLLKKISTPIKLSDEIKLIPNKNYSAVTFDDGFKNVMDNALPILKKNNVPATLFCLGSNFGEKPLWNYDPVTEDKYEYIMTIDEIKSLPEDIFDIGSHTMTHAKLSKLSLEEVKHELLESKNILESILSKEVKLFSFPNGEYNQDVINLAQKYGYKKIFTIDPQIAYPIDDKIVFGRFNVDPSDWEIEFKLKALGHYRWLMNVKKIKRKIKWN